MIFENDDVHEVPSQSLTAVYHDAGHGCKSYLEALPKRMASA